MATRIGVDVGGTFTDLIFYDDESGEVRVAKEPTTPAAPEEGVVRAVVAGVPPQLIGGAAYFLHGTTVGLNALLERKGAVVGLLATQGFRDILEIRRGDRGETYNIFWKQPPPLVPRRLRLTVRERMRDDGSVHQALNDADIAAAVEVFAKEGVTSVAVAFMNAYANPAHERAAERLLRKFGFSGQISLSHQVGGEFREYERTSTTVIDAYVRPKVATYLERLGQQLRSTGVGGDLLITRSGGGAVTFEEAGVRPVETILSGPVAGAEGAAELAVKLDLGDVVSADVGGTSFDTCLITGGRPQMMYESQIMGLPVQTPWVDVRSIGTGGGSIAYVDVGGLLRVGPHSAGADPGPAAYGRGGRAPTVTDAAFFLGMLGDGEIAAGIRLDQAKAEAALAPLGETLGLTVDDVARGVLTISTASMANAIRVITVEQGNDPRQAKLIAFGGAGPLFATLLARELNIRQAVIPPYAGNFSAWGLLGADLTRTASRTRIVKCTAEGLIVANQLLSALFEEVESRTSDADRTGQSREVALDVRYVGQEHTLTVEVESRDGEIAVAPSEIRRAFMREYERSFGHTMDEEVELVNVRATVVKPLAHREHRHVHDTARSVERISQSRPAYSFTRGQRMSFKVMHRSDLSSQTRLDGPAIIIEETATTYVDADFTVHVDPSGCLFLTDAVEAV